MPKKRRQTSTQKNRRRARSVSVQRSSTNKRAASTKKDGPRASRNTARSTRSNSGKGKKQKSEPQSAVELWLKKDGWAIALTIALLLGGGWYLGFYTGNYTITNVSVDETTYIPTSELQSAVEEYIQGTTLGVLPRNNSWVLRTNLLEQDISDRFSEEFYIESINAWQPDNTSVHLSVHERVPQLAWVTKNAAGQEYFYLVDRGGVVVQQVSSFTELDPTLPRVRDDNRAELGLGWQIMSPEYISAVLDVNDRLATETGLQVDSFIFPETLCQQREFVAEKVFQQQLLDEASEEFREKKRNIQEQFQLGLITIDQSIDLLEDIKNEELGKQGAVQDAAFEKFEWEVVYVDTECDYVKIATELQVVTLGGEGEANGVTLQMSTIEDLTIQMENVQATLLNGGVDRNAIEYIDVRLIDRAYVK